MSSKPIYIGVIGFLTIALIVIVAIIVGGGSNPVAIGSDAAQGNIKNLFNNDTLFPSEAGETLKMSIKTNNNYLVTGKKNDLYVQLDFSAIKHEVEKRLPLNVSLVLDRSGSMSGEKLDQAKKAVVAFIESLSPDDYLSVVTYESGVETIYAQSKIENVDALKEIILSIQDAGGTFLSGGLEEGIKQISSKKSSEFINRVILFSDGQANEGISDIEGLSAIAKKAAREGISVSTMGVGVDYDEKIMSAIAIGGSGNYQYIKNAEMISKVLATELSQLKSIVASEAKVKIIHDPSITFVKTFGYTYNSADGYVEIPIRDFFSQDKGMTILHFTTDTKKISNHNMKIILSYKDSVNGNIEQEYDTGVALSITDKQKLYDEHLNTDVMGEVLKIKNTVAMEEANEAFERGEKEKALKIFTSIITETKKLNDEYLFDEEVTEQIGYMEQQKGIVDKIDDTTGASAKDYLKCNRADNMNAQQGRVVNDDDDDDDDGDDEDGN